MIINNYNLSHTRLYEQEYHEPDNQFSDKFILKYNIIGILTKAIHYDENNKSFQKIKYYYKGKKRIKSVCFNDGKLFMTTKYIYKDGSYVIDKIMNYDSHNFNYAYSIMKYENKRWIGYEQYLEETKKTDNYIFVYDDDNRIIETIKNGKVFSTRKYNEKGQLILIIMTDGLKIKFKWEKKKSKHDINQYLLY